MATPAATPHIIGYRGNEDTVSADRSTRVGAICLFATSVGFGILLGVAGFLLVLVGYLARVSLDEDSDYYREEMQRLKDCRTPGWVMLFSGMLLLIVAIIGVVKSERWIQSSAASRQASTVVPLVHPSAWQFRAQPTAPGIDEAEMVPAGAPHF